MKKSEVINMMNATNAFKKIAIVQKCWGKWVSVDDIRQAIIGTNGRGATLSNTHSHLISLENEWGVPVRWRDYFQVKIGG